MGQIAVAKMSEHSFSSDAVSDGAIIPGFPAWVTFVWLGVACMANVVFLCTGGDFKRESHIFKHKVGAFNHIMQIVAIWPYLHTSILYIMWYIVVGGAFIVGAISVHRPRSERTCGVPGMGLVEDGQLEHQIEPMLNTIQIVLALLISPNIYFALANVPIINGNIGSLVFGLQSYYDADGVNMMSLPWNADTWYAVLTTATLTFLELHLVFYRGELADPTMVVLSLLSVLVLLGIFFYLLKYETAQQPKYAAMARIAKAYYANLKTEERQFPPSNTADAESNALISSSDAEMLLPC